MLHTLKTAIRSKPKLLHPTSTTWSRSSRGSPILTPEVFQTLYLDKGSKGVKGFIPGRIKMLRTWRSGLKGAVFTVQIKPSTDKIPGMMDDIRKSLVKLKELYPEAIFPPVYGNWYHEFGWNIIGWRADYWCRDVWTTAGRPRKKSLTIGRSLCSNRWRRCPHRCAHGWIHFQQTYDGGTLLQACLKERQCRFHCGIDFSKHINGHVHDFVIQRKELWLEFQDRMFEKIMMAALVLLPDGQTIWDTGWL